MQPNTKTNMAKPKRSSQINRDQFIINHTTINGVFGDTSTKRGFLINVSDTLFNAMLRVGVTKKKPCWK